MGHNPSRNPFKRACPGMDAQPAVDEYKARSEWRAWWELDESVRRRYFTREDRAVITRYRSRLDALATYRETPQNEKEQHSVRVCMGEAEPSMPRERMWLIVQLVCCLEAAATRSARADLAEHDAFALRAENRKLKAKCDHREVFIAALQRGEYQLEDRPAEVRSICNVVHATMRFAMAPCSPWPIGSNLRRVVATCQ